MGPRLLTGVVLVVTFKRDRDSFKHVVLTGAALAVLFAAGLALVAAATL